MLLPFLAFLFLVFIHGVVAKVLRQAKKCFSLGGKEKRNVFGVRELGNLGNTETVHQVTLQEETAK